MAKQEQTLDSYESSTYGKELFVAKAKIGKTCTLIGNILGVMPWQEHGGIVDKPENLHVLTFDAAAADGVKEFLVNECGAPKEIGKVHIENLQRAAEKSFTGTGDYDGQFINTVYDAVHKIQDRTTRPGVHVVLVSSLTMFAKAALRSLSGPAFIMNGTSMKKSPMDQNKWNLLKQIMTEFQWSVQQDSYHTFWEGHHGEKTSKETDGSGAPKVFDTIQLDGGTAKSFPAQVERIWEIHRSSMKWAGKDKKPSKVSLVHFDPFPTFDFGEVQTGRKASSRLEPKEPCLTMAFHKLGLKIGGFGT
jgi:hypothetical protein